MPLALDEIRGRIEGDTVDAELDEWLELLLEDENGLLDQLL